MNPSPRHSKCGRSSNTSAITSSARRLPSCGTTRVYWFSTSQRPSRQLAQDHQDRLQDVERLEARDHDRPAVVGRDELERPRADDRADVAGADEAVEAQVGRLEQRPQRRHDRDVVAHAREVRHALGLGALERQRGRRRGRLEADREEHDLAVRVLAARSAARRAASRPSGCRRPRPSRRAGVPFDPGTRSMSPKQVKITPSSCGDRDPVVDAAHRDHAHRAAGAVHELDVGRQQVVDPVLVDRVRVAAAHLHHLVVAAGLDQRQDLAGHGAAELGVAELVDELHAHLAPRLRAIAVPAWTSSHVAGRDRLDERRSRRRSWRRALIVRSRRRRASRRRRRPSSATPSSPQVMQ